MNTTAWTGGIVDHDEGLHLRRWFIAGTIVVLTYSGLAAAYVYLGPKPEPAGAASPPILIDFAPEAAAPETEADLAPGEESAESQEQPLPEVKQAATEEPVIEVPQTETPEPEIVIPPKKEEVVEKQEEPTPKPPEPVKEKPVERSVKSVKREQSAPKVEKRARSAVAPNPGSQSSVTALREYRSLLIAHLQRFKRVPKGGTGTALVGFTVSRNGHIVSRSLLRSSGNASVDAEAMSMIARAQPMPAFPAAMTQAQIYFSVPFKATVTQ